MHNTISIYYNTTNKRFVSEDDSTKRSQLSSTSSRPEATMKRIGNKKTSSINFGLTKNT